LRSVNEAVHCRAGLSRQALKRCKALLDGIRDARRQRPFPISVEFGAEIAVAIDTQDNGCRLDVGFGRQRGLSKGDRREVENWASRNWELGNWELGNTDASEKRTLHRG
jgi:hypothetical protein